MNKKVFLILALLCAVAQGAWSESVTFRVRSWDDVNKQVVTISQTKNATVLEGIHKDDWIGLDNGYYVVKSNTEYKVLNIMGDDVHLILTGGAKLACKHVKLEGNNKLHIHDIADDNTGTLEVKNSKIITRTKGKKVGGGTSQSDEICGVFHGAAAIGSAYQVNMGSFYVHGGTVYALEGGMGAAIGGGADASIGGEVVVYAGTVEAHVKSNDYSGAAIGGGEEGNQGGPVTIYGGKVKAFVNESIERANDGAGIGGGANGGHGGTVTIWGGEVLALGGKRGTGIGSGDSGNGGNVHIYGGTVEAHGGKKCSAIGCYGSNSLGTVAFGDHMKVTGGTASRGSEDDQLNTTVERVFTGGEREAACQWRNWVKVEACDHTTPTQGNDTTDPITYSIDDDIYHTKHCRYCNTTWKEEHNGTDCVCGKTSFYRFTVHYPGTKKDTYDESSTIAIGASMDFYLPSCKNVPEGYIFKGWEMNPATDDVNRWAAVRGGDQSADINMPAGTSVKTYLGQEKEVNFYARFLYDFTPTWSWGANGSSASVTLSHKDLNDETLSSTGATPKVTIVSADLKETVTIINNDETTSEEEVKIGTRYTATCTYELNGYEYTFTDTYDILDVPAVEDMTLNDDADNSETITYNYECPVNATLTGRTLYKDGLWNTLCLPFDLTIAGSPLEGATVKTLESSDYDILTGELTLNFTTGSLTTLRAGTPYLVKWDKPDPYTAYDGNNASTCNDIVAPTFSGVTISAIEGSSAGSMYVDFVGSFSPVAIEANDNAVLYLGAGNKLYYPTKNRTMGSCRAVFRLHNGLAVGDLAAGGAKATRFVMNFGSDDTTGIVEVNADEDLKSASYESGISNPLQRAWFDLQGRRLTGKPTAKGLYINNGKKVVIK